jgi:hypothetical protein
VRIVDPEYALPAWVMQRQRISDAVWPCTILRDAAAVDFNPKAAADFGQKTMEIKEPLKAGSRSAMAKRYE